MQNNSFLKLLFLVSIISFFASCDKDFNEIGSDIVDNNHFDLNPDESNAVIAYNQATGSVETSNLSVNSLGFYNNPFFGKTRASVVSQVILDTVNQTIGTNPIVTKVELSLPYFSHLVSTDATSGDRTYELDSVHGYVKVNDKKVFNKIKLNVYESNYYLRDLDASLGFLDSQKYYSGATSDFDANKNPNRLNEDTDLSQNEEFLFSAAEIKTYKLVDGVSTVDTRSAPGMRLKLRTEFFQDKLFGAGATGKFLNNTIFKEYFRGLYFKADNASSSTEQGSMALLNFRLGKIIVTYNVTVTSSTGVPSTKEMKFGISLSGNSVNLLENDYTSQYTSGLASNSNATTGAYNLYPKGGEGSMTVIELFDKTDIKGWDKLTGTFVSGRNNVSDQLEDIRHPADNKNLLVNEANLTFYIDKTKMTGATEPNRVYLYDLNNHTPIIDYYYDNTVASNVKNNKYVHGGIIEKETLSTIVDKRGIKYKLRLTNHLRNLISKDSTNVRLGLVVTESIAVATNSKLKNATSGLNPFSKLPTCSVINPLGTVLFGNNIPASDPNYANRLKLEIYYTKPKPN
jgi:hypothetical protein